ncbi:MAG: indole-3-glycerol phosphate synthase TrpC [bacterium]|nr:indole-3-glycerol phosphate synthase TrpC [bacterium]
MTGTILDKIFSDKRVRVEAAKQASESVDLRELALEYRSNRGPHRLRQTLSDGSGINIIAEFKKASPSKGVINDSVESADVARQYEAGGAAAISVLTEEDHFKGSLDDLQAVREAVDLPILRKDFFFDEFQIYEAAVAGADAILLIAAMLEDEQLEKFRSLAEDELGLDALVEVHTLDELERIKRIGSKLIGVNNRDLKSFHVTLDVSRELIQHAPKGTIMVTESGLRTLEELLELSELGYVGFLIGETLMRTGDPAAELRRLRDVR